MLCWPLYLPNCDHLELHAQPLQWLNTPQVVRSHPQETLPFLTAHKDIVVPSLDFERPHQEASPPAELREPASLQDAIRAAPIPLLTRATSLPNTVDHRQFQISRAVSCPPGSRHDEDFDDSTDQIKTSVQIPDVPKHDASAAISSSSAHTLASTSVRLSRSVTPELDVPMMSSSQETICAPLSDTIEPAGVPEIVECQGSEDSLRQACIISSSPSELDQSIASAVTSASSLGKRRREESQARSTKIIRVLKKPFVTPIRSKPLTEETNKINDQLTISVEVETPKTTAQPLVTPTPAARPSTTRRLATPFRPPRAAASALPAVNLRSLEDRARLLRQAVRFHTRPEEDDHLEELVQKWRSAGREIVERLFSCVPRPDAAGSFVGWQGYNPMPLDRSGDVFMASAVPQEQQDHPDSKMEEIETPRWSFGAMMTQMGVDPTLLGWDEGEEDWCE